MSDILYTEHKVYAGAKEKRRASDDDAQAAHPYNPQAHNLAFVIVIAWEFVGAATFVIALLNAWQNYQEMQFLTDLQVIGMAATFGLTGVPVYKIVYHGYSFAHPMEEQPIETTITEREIQEGTERMNYATGTNVNRAAVMNHGQEIIQLDEEPFVVGNMEFSSDQMAFLRRAAIKSNHISQDGEWLAMNEAGMIAGSYKKHYGLAKELFSHSSRKWITNNRWTPRAYEEFLKVDPPTPMG